MAWLAHGSILIFVLVAVQCCEEGFRFRQGSFYKECKNGEISRAGCYADWLTSEAAYVPFQSYVDHILHPQMGYRFYCRSRGSSYSFQIESCVLRDRNGELKELRVGESGQIQGNNGRFAFFVCRR